MKNYSVLRPMTRAVYCQCLDKAQVSPLYKPSSTNWTILSDCLEKLGFKPLERISAKVKYVTSWVMTLIRVSGRATAKSTPLQLKRVTIQLLRSRWNYNSCSISNSLVWRLQTNPFLERLSLQINEKSLLIWKSSHNSKPSKPKRKR